MQFTHSSCELRKIRWIRTHGQQSRSESSELQKNTVNDANSVPFAQHISKSHEIRDICEQQTR